MFRLSKMGCFKGFLLSVVQFTQVRIVLDRLARTVLANT